jgi:AraC family transcriptional regulator
MQMHSDSYAGVDWVDGETHRREKLRPSGSLTNTHCWTGATIEEWQQTVPGERSEGFLLRHVIAVPTGAPSIVQIRWSGGRWKTYALNATFVQIMPALRPYAITWNPITTVLVEMSPCFVTSVGGGSSRGPIELHPNGALHDDVISHLVLALREEARTDCPLGQTYGETLTVALAAHLVRHYSEAATRFGGESSSSRGMSDAVLRRVLDYINEHIATEIRLDQIADLARLDLYRFIRSFTRLVGMPPHHYIIQRRVGLSKELLNNSRLPLAVIAHRCGFATPSHFTSTFRRLAGITPSAYRQSCSPAGPLSVRTPSVYADRPPACD